VTKRREAFVFRLKVNFDRSKDVYICLISVGDLLCARIIHHLRTTGWKAHTGNSMVNYCYAFGDIESRFISLVLLAVDVANQHCRESQFNYLCLCGHLC
jgi:hypothetical protein